MNYYPLLSDKSIIEAVVLANGEYPTHLLPLSLLQNAPRVVCCDGAANEYISKGHIPSAIIGDGDSVKPEYRERFANLIHYDHDQETNDQTKAVNYCLFQGWKNIFIVGATGKREDHTIGNISLLLDYMAHINVQMVTDYGWFTPVEGEATFECYPHTQISLINFGATGIRGENLRYPLRDFSNWWQGTLNEVEGNEFTIHAHGRYLIYRTFPNPQ